ncbi:GbsR/MarR family transcriptional regulator [Bacillus dakarensis]|uniref:GbsR/MarR family transcriptional regulator n=1 Tax=Robertmurraya dakarensis TaxID=1926278 RepID=UPI00098237C7|nr:GbsR/MarR family transcriptional regulator [Bacillus dakarensis]
MNGKEQLDQARERVIETMAQNMNLYGVTDSIGRLYGMLYFHDEPMTLDDMKEELGMSKTSMSTSVRHLLELKMVEKVWKKGIRKDLYKVEEDWYQSFTDYFNIKWRYGIARNILAIEKSMTELNKLVASEDTDEEVRAEAKADLMKLQNALNYYDWIERFIDCLESGKIFEIVPRKEH